MNAPHDLRAGRIIEVRHLRPGLVGLEAGQEKVPESLGTRLRLELFHERWREDVLVLDDARVVRVARRHVLGNENPELGLNPVRLLRVFEVHGRVPVLPQLHDTMRQDRASVYETWPSSIIFRTSVMPIISRIHAKEPCSFIARPAL